MQPLLDVSAAETVTRVKVVAIAILLSAPQLLAYAPIFEAYGAGPASRLFVAWGVLSLIIGIVLLWRANYYRPVLLIETFLVLLANFAAVLMLGGLEQSAGQILWTLLAPITLLVFFGPSAGITAFVGFIVLLGAATWVGAVVPAKSPLPSHIRHAMFVTNVLLTCSFTFGTLCIYEWRRRQLFSASSGNTTGRSDCWSRCCPPQSQNASHETAVLSPTALPM